jgi:hypothetical protein
VCECRVTWDSCVPGVTAGARRGPGGSRCRPDPARTKRARSPSGGNALGATTLPPTRNRSAGTAVDHPSARQAEIRCSIWHVERLTTASEESAMATQGRSLTGRLLEILRSWWPVAAFLILVLVAQTLWSGRYEVAGHAADHLQSATPVFPMTFLSAVLLWALPGCGRRDRLLWLLLAAAIASCLVVLVGNVRVIEAIDGAPGPMRRPVSSAQPAPASRRATTWPSSAPGGRCWRRCSRLGCCGSAGWCRPRSPRRPPRSVS